MDKHGGLINFDEIIDLMKNPINFSGPMFTKLTTKDKYASFLGMSASGIVGYHRYKTNLRKHIARDPKGLCHNWITPDDEAMCWLMIENGLEKWNVEFKLRCEKIEQSDDSDGPNYGGFQSTRLTKIQRCNLPFLKYTEKTTDAGKKKLCAWDLKAVARFKKLKREVELFRYEHEVIRLNSREVKRPLLEEVNGKMVYKLTTKYKAYSVHATDVLARVLQEETPDSSTTKKRMGQDMSEHEQKRKREIDEIYNDGALSMFSNVACSMPFMDV